MVNSGRTSGREADAAEPRREAAFEPRLEPRRGSAAERMEPRLPAPVAERRRPGAEILGIFNGERGKLLWLEEILYITLDGWNPLNNGINHLSTGAGFLPSTVGQERLEVGWEVVMFLFNIVNLNVWLFLFDYLAKCFVEVVVIMFGLDEGRFCWGCFGSYGFYVVVQCVFLGFDDLLGHC